MRRLAFVLAASLAIASVPTAAFAQKPKKTIAERLSAEAKKHWDAALLLYEQKNWSAALAEFVAAYDVSKEPRVLRNVAICEKNLQRYARALAALERELAEAPDLEADAKKKVQEEIDILRPLTGLVAIDLSEPDAVVTIDGAEVTPGAPIRVDVGERVVAAKKPGFKDASQTVLVTAASPAKATLVLEPLEKKGTLVVRAIGLPESAQAKIAIDGASVGNAPWMGEVSAGSHTITVSSVGYVEEKVARDVEWKKTTTVEVKLAPAPHEGTISVDPGLPKAIVRVDGKIVGTGAWSGKVESGPHTIDVSADGYADYHVDLTVNDGATRSMSLVLEKKSPAWLWWAAGGAAAIGLGVGAYFAFRKHDEEPVAGSISPGTVQIRGF